MFDVSHISGTTDNICHSLALCDTWLKWRYFSHGHNFSTLTPNVNVINAPFLPSQYMDTCNSGGYLPHNTYVQLFLVKLGRLNTTYKEQLTFVHCLHRHSGIITFRLTTKLPVQARQNEVMISFASSQVNVHELRICFHGIMLILTTLHTLVFQPSARTCVKLTNCLGAKADSTSHETSARW
jgi:hypothetical protein